MAPKTFDDSIPSSIPQSPQSQQRSNIPNIPNIPNVPNIPIGSSRHYQSSSTTNLPSINNRNTTQTSRLNSLDINNNNNPSRRYIPRRHRFTSSTFSTSYNNNMSNNMPFYDQRIITHTPSRRSSSRYSFASNGSDTVTTLNNGDFNGNNFNNNIT